MTQIIDGRAIMKYEHHGAIVAVQGENKGKHRDNCLCFVCGRFFPEDRDKNCPIANILYNLCVILNITTPVWECAEWIKPD